MASREEVIKLTLEKGLDPATIFPDYNAATEAPAPDLDADVDEFLPPLEAATPTESAPVDDGDTAFDSLQSEENPDDVFSTLAGETSVVQKPQSNISVVPTIELSDIDFNDLSFEEISQLASSPEEQSGLTTNARRQLAAALRGSTTAEGTFSEFLVGDSSKAGSYGEGLFDRADPEIVAKTQEIEKLLETKYDDFVERNPEQDTGFFGKVYNSIMTGSPVPEIDGIEGQPLSTTARAFTDTAGNAVVGGFGDELMGVGGLAAAAERTKASREQIYDESTVAGLSAEVLGSLAPASALGKAVGLGKAGVGAVSNTIRGIGAAAIEGGIAGAGYTEEDESRVTNALIGASAAAAGGVVLSTVGRAAAPFVAKLVNGSKLFTKSETKAAEGFFDLIESTTGVSPATIKAGLKDNKNITRILVDNDVDPDKILKINQGLIVDDAASSTVRSAATSRLSAAGDDALGRRQPAIAQQAANVKDAGEAVGTLRHAADPENTRLVIQDMLQTDSGPRFHAALTKKVLEEISDNRNVLADAGYGLKGKPRVHIDEETGGIWLINKNAKPVKLDTDLLFDPSVHIDIDDKIYMLDDLTPYDANMKLLQSTGSDIDSIVARQLKEGEAPDQNLGERAAKITADLRQFEEEVTEGLSTVNTRYSDAKSVQQLQSQADSIFSGSNSTASVAELADTVNGISTAGMSANDKLGVFINALDDQIAKGNYTGPLTKSNDNMNTIVLNALREQGASPDYIRNMEGVLKELHATNRLLGKSLEPDEHMSFLKRVFNGTTSRWYLGPQKAFAASLLFNAVVGAGTVNSVTGKVAKSLKSVKPEVRERIIQNMLNTPDAEFSKLMELVLNRKSDAQLATALRKTTGIAGGGVAAAAVTTPPDAAREDMSALGVQ